MRKSELSKETINSYAINQPETISDIFCDNIRIINVLKISFQRMKESSQNF